MNQLVLKFVQHHFPQSDISVKDVETFFNKFIHESSSQTRIHNDDIKNTITLSTTSTQTTTTQPPTPTTTTQTTTTQPNIPSQTTTPVDFSDENDIHLCQARKPQQAPGYPARYGLSLIHI